MSLANKWMRKKIPSFCNLALGTIHLRRRHVLGGEGGSQLPMFADARGVGVLDLPTSAIFGHILTYRISIFSITIQEEIKNSRWASAMTLWRGQSKGLCPC